MSFSLNISSCLNGLRSGSSPQHCASPGQSSTAGGCSTAGRRTGGAWRVCLAWWYWSQTPRSCPSWGSWCPALQTLSGAFPLLPPAQAQSVRKGKGLVSLAVSVWQREVAAFVLMHEPLQCAEILSVPKMIYWMKAWPVPHLLLGILRCSKSARSLLIHFCPGRYPICTEKVEVERAHDATSKIQWQPLRVCMWLDVCTLSINTKNLTNCHVQQLSRSD